MSLSKSPVSWLRVYVLNQLGYVDGYLSMDRNSFEGLASMGVNEIRKE